MPHCLGIDIGSSFIKAAVIDPDAGALLRTRRVPFPAFAPGLPAQHREVNPGAIMTAVEQVLRGLAEVECAGVVLCRQMHGFILVNCRGEAVSNYISWLDQRVTPAEFEEMSARVTEAERRELGN